MKSNRSWPLLTKVDENLDHTYVINFKTDVSKNLKVKISGDNSRILFTNMGETFLVKIKDDQQVHRFLDHLNQKIVRFIYEDPMDGFFLVSCDDYDTNFLLQHATDTSYKVEIDKRIEPGNLIIYDLRSNMK